MQIKMNILFFSLQLEQLYRLVMITEYKGQKLQCALLGHAKIILTAVKMNWLLLGYSGECGDSWLLGFSLVEDS